MSQTVQPITVIQGELVDLISPFPPSELHRIYRWKHCYRSLSNSDLIPQDEQSFLEYITPLIGVFSTWGVIDKLQSTTQKFEAPIVGVIALEQVGVGVNLHFASSRTAFKLGLVDDALHTLLGRVFQVDGIQRVGCSLDDKNPAAKALLRRHGFRVEGVCRDANVWRSAPEDLVWFGLTRRQWDVDHPPTVDQIEPPTVVEETPSSEGEETPIATEVAVVMDEEASEAYEL